MQQHISFLSSQVRFWSHVGELSGLIPHITTWNMIPNNMQQESNPPLHHLLYLYQFFPLSDISQRRHGSLRNCFRSHEGLFRKLPEFQASHSHDSCSDMLYLHVYHHRSFLQSWDESFRLCYLPTHSCWCGDASICLFHRKVNRHFLESILHS